MQCPKCSTGIMVGDIDMARADGSGGCWQLSTRVWRCPLCGMRLYEDVVPVVVLKREQLEPDATKVYSGGRPKGSRPSDAVALVVEYFDWIRNEVDNGIGWPTIAKLLKQATGARFCQKTLSRHWHQERERRVIQKEAGRRSGRAAAAKRAEVAA